MKFDLWYEYYLLAKAYYEKHGNLLIPALYEVNINNKTYRLGAWTSLQRQIYKGNANGQLTEMQIKLLDDIDMVWDVYMYNWMFNYNLAKAYYEKHGNLKVPYEYEVKVGNEVYKLGVWISTQRRAYKGIGAYKIDEKQIALLNKIDMIWEVRENSWEFYYDLAKAYYEKHGNLNVSCDYKAIYNGKVYDLYRWVNAQRKKYQNNKLSIEKTRLLDDIRMIWDFKEYIAKEYTNKWYQTYLLAKQYYEKNGDLLINANYEVSYNGKIIKLGDWINTQRKLYKNHKLNDTKIGLLEEIGMVWYVKEQIKNEKSDSWDNMYLLAKKYFEQHGNLFVPSNYEMVVGNKKVDLDLWLQKQRVDYKANRLTVDQIKLLNKIQMIWDLKKFAKTNYSRKWYQSYLLAKKYYEEHGNLLIPLNYSVRTGNTTIYLGKWLYIQKFNYMRNRRLNEVQIGLLNDIKIDWNINQKEDDLLVKYNYVDDENLKENEKRYVKRND